MGRSRFKILDERYPYFITSSIVNRYHIFKDKSCCEVIIDGLNFLIGERGIRIHAYVIMPDHIHIISQGKDLGKHISGFKSYAARRIIDLLEAQNNEAWLQRFKYKGPRSRKDREHQIWMEGFHPKQIMSAKVMEQKIYYIHYNPVKAGLVESESDWLYSSYGDYDGNSSGLVEIDGFRG
jgi:REP element-mobilizing transposase RayT